ncbi:MAG TPA: DUF721 domain-containing protein [Rhizobiales bacterium]|nr:DUF721 domain-containing protein [Hyphomicrobiales bacterium]
MKAVGKHFARVAEKAYARHGVAWAGLLTDWPGIIGAPLCDLCLPEKVTWPGQGKARAGQGTSNRSKHQKIGGTLVIRVAYGRALEIQHMTPQIIDRINVYYGYNAISQIKILQGKVEKPKIVIKHRLPPLSPDISDQLDHQMTAIEDDKLKTALRNLAKGVLAPNGEV